MQFSRDLTRPIGYQTGEAVPKGVRTATGASGWIDVGDARELILQLDANGGTGTTPTLDVRLQTSFDGADATAVDVPTGAFTQVTTVASMQVKRLTDFHRFVKIAWTVAGTTPSFMFGAYLTARDR